ncbi:Tar ligand binding domain-containing protein, partial [Achromobacter sp. DMS1]|uniref:Tar ligand binding domain-containing protein n=1 Tax=Achromobacter sp. DMS1 TaxID=1688405 RepID=UPI001F31B2DB
MKRNLKVTTAMTAALAVFVVLFAVAAAAGIAVLRDNRAQIEALGRGSIERAGDLAETTGRLFQARAALTDAKTAMESGMQEARDAHLAQAQALLAQAAAGAGRLRANPDGDPDGGPLFDRVLAAYGRFADGALAPLHKAIQGWNGIEASRIVEQALAPAGAAYVQSADAYQVHARQRGEAAVAG